jgi:hypothetical protein
VDWINLAQDTEKVTRCCELGNGIPGSIKCLDYYKQLQIYQLLKKGPTVWSSLVGTTARRLKCAEHKEIKLDVISSFFQNAYKYK